MEDSKITEQATDWLSTIEEGGLQEHEKFAAWLRESPRHVGEFLAVSAVWRQFDGMDPRRELSIEQILASTAPNVVALTAAPAPAASARPRRRWFVAGAAAAAVLVGIAGWWAMGAAAGWKTYETELGEQRILELADGSMVHLNTRSQVRVKLTDSNRDIRLVSGEALFTVARSTGRPFRVHAGDMTIQALGTQFNVYRRERGTRVSVLEGAVQISGDGPGETKESGVLTRLDAGEQVDIAPGGKVEALPAVKELDASAWRQHRLVFFEDRLADVAAEFNRYNRAPRLLVEGSLAEERRLTGVFDASDPDSLLQFLSDTRELSIQRRGDEVIVRGR